MNRNTPVLRIHPRLFLPLVRKGPLNHPHSESHLFLSGCFPAQLFPEVLPAQPFSEVLPESRVPPPESQRMRDPAGLPPLSLILLPVLPKRVQVLP